MKLFPHPLRILPFLHVIQGEMNFFDARYIFEEKILYCVFSTAFFQKNESWLLVPLFGLEQNWVCYSAFNKLCSNISQARDVNLKHTGRKCQKERQRKRGEDIGVMACKLSVSSVLSLIPSGFTVWLECTDGVSICEILQLTPNSIYPFLYLWLRQTHFKLLQCGFYPEQCNLNLFCSNPLRTVHLGIVEGFRLDLLNLIHFKNVHLSINQLTANQTTFITCMTHEDYNKTIP